jgi:ferritin-like metal-binding protein YciE
MATKNAGKNQGSSNGQSKQNGQGTQGAQTRESLLKKFFEDQLKDIYYAEQQMFKALDEMKAACTTEELEDAFEQHKKQTERHIKRLEKVFQMLGTEPQGKKCEAMDGLIKETKSIINETQAGSMTRDAALIIAAQKSEHYEIATYGGLVQLAITMGKHRAARLLDKTLKEEEDTDLMLTEIAEAHINFEAEEEESKSQFGTSQSSGSRNSGSRNQGSQSSASSSMEEEEEEMAESAVM